jgi:hypothetical protein
MLLKIQLEIVSLKLNRIVVDQTLQDLFFSILKSKTFFSKLIGKLRYRDWVDFQMQIIFN